MLYQLDLHEKTKGSYRLLLKSERIYPVNEITYLGCFAAFGLTVNLAVSQNAALQFD